MRRGGQTPAGQSLVASLPVPAAEPTENDDRAMTKGVHSRPEHAGSDEYRAGVTPV